MKMVKLPVWLLSLFVLALALSSCEDSPNAEGTSQAEDSSKYSIWVYVNDGSYLLSTDDLMKDTVISPLNSGIDITSYLPAAYYGVYAYAWDGYYYLSNDGTRLSQFELTDYGTFNEIDNLAWSSSFYLSCVSPNSDEDQMIFISTSWNTSEDENEEVFLKKVYDLNTSTMEISNTYEAKIPFLPYTVNKPDSEEEDDVIAFVTGFGTNNGRAYFSFAYYSQTTWESVNDTAYVYMCDFPEMTNGTLLKDGRAGSVTGWWSTEKSSFFDEDDNYYFTVEDASGNISVLRIEDGATEIDTDFIIDLSDYDISSDECHAYIADGKAYIKPLIVDLENKSVVTDLSSLGYGSPETTTSLVDDGKLYDIFKTDESEWYVCMYDTETNTLTRGLQIDEGISWIYHLNKLK